MNLDIRQLSSDEFPQLLTEIPDAPKKLYVRGTLPPADIKLLAVVGSRKYTPYGKQAVETLLKGLAGYPIAIISGLALGIDSLAHEAALASNLPTIAVPGSGLNDDVLYPSMHRKLAQKILVAGGALLSEFEPDFRATPYSFPQRNRIMAGMSHAVLMIEAAEKSGTLITARLTSDYNRELLVVPGSIFSANSFGPHLFLSLGATPITRSADILRVFGMEPAAKSALLRTDISEEERQVMEALQTPLSRDELIVALALKTQDANILLSTMELKGLITEEFGKIHAL